MIAITSTFVAEPLEPPLGRMLAELGMDTAVAFAPYHQVFQELLTPGSLLDRYRDGIGVALIRLEDFARDQVADAAAAARLTRTGAELADALQRYAAGAKGSLLAVVLPPSPRVPAALLPALNAATEDLRATLVTGGAVQVVTMAEIERVAGNQGAAACREAPAAVHYDERRDTLAHIPYTDTFYATLAIALARRIHAIRVPAMKVLALDCDNTLWRGVVGEDGVDGITLSAPYLALQEFALEQQRKGVLIALVSKNAEADVIEVLARRPDIKLGAADVVAHRINWLPKAANLQSLAAELNLGLDAFVFLDDNPVECGQVREALPQVVTLQVPAEEEIVAWLAHVWCFDKLATTDEDARRTQMYRENAARRQLETSVTDIGDFLAALELQVDIAEPAADEWARIEQLTQRTNQFNFTTRRRSVAELKALVEQGRLIRRVRVADRFGDYGLVGVLIAGDEGGTLAVDTFLLSCRVLGRGVEHAMLQALGEIAQQRGLDSVQLRLITTPRNEPARAFVDSVAADWRETLVDGVAYRLPAAEAAAVRHRPGHDPEAVVQARLADERKGSKPAAAGTAATVRSDRYARLATVLTSGEHLLAELDRADRRRRDLPTPATPPGTPLERELVALWEEVLGIDGLGVDDDYFALGGTSLASVRLFSEIARRFGTELRLTTILAAPTVRALAAFLTPATANAPPAAVTPAGMVAKAAAAEDTAASATGAVAKRDSLVPLRPGGPANFFFVHDGLGETLLYLNLARRLPAEYAVYGIEPARLPGIPLAHASIEAMAAHYVAQIRAIQPTGPYRLGGMCAGGVIAYAMAHALRTQGEAVALVAVLDGATPQADKRAHRVTQQRMTRLRALLKGDDPERGNPGVLGLAGTVAQKAWNAASYEVGARRARKSAQRRFGLLCQCVEHGAAWPAGEPPLTVAEIYTELEARYQAPALPDVPVLLVRATAGQDGDAPYRDVYADEAFGWRAVASRLVVADVAGGHASMLQEAHVDSLAAALLAHLPPGGGGGGDGGSGADARRTVGEIVA